MDRKLGIAAYTILLLMLLILNADFYLSREFYPPSADMFLNEPFKYAGNKIAFAGNFLNASANSFYVSVNRRPIKVHYSLQEKPNFGQISVLAMANSDGTVSAIEVHNLSYNYLKYIISFFAFTLFLFIFFREWKLKRWRFVENA